jgi:hypothetical protein
LQDPRSPHPAVARLELTQVSTSRKVVLATSPVLGITGMAFFLGMGASDATRDPATSSSDLLIFLGSLLLVLYLLYIFTLATLFRSGAWLGGTTLVMCDGLRTRRRDLATVPVGLGSYVGHPVLVAWDNTTGRKARLALGRLTAPQLTALADAIMAGGRQDPGAWRAAATLRQWAASWQYRPPAGAPGPRG